MPDQKNSVLLGALVVAILSTSYLSLINCLCCLGVIIGSMTAVWHYTSTYGVTIELGHGALLGVLAAALGTLIATIANYLLVQMGLDANAAIAETVISMFSDAMSPEQLDELRSQLQNRQDVSFGQHLISGAFGIIIASLFGALGGVIGASVFKKGGDGASESDVLLDTPIAE